MVWEERWHPLREEWVVVAAHRQGRPWSGQAESIGDLPKPRYSADCYLCPGNRRVSGAENPDYSGVFAFDNDHPCVGSHAPSNAAEEGLFRVRPAYGRARVLCYHPRHDQRLAELPLESVVVLLRAWQDEYRMLARDPEIKHVLVFENNGEVVGVSNPHPHCQIYATNFVMKTIETEVAAARRHFEQTGRILFADVLAAEYEASTRILDQNASAVSFVPFFARYSYETFVAPRRSYPSLAALPDQELVDLAEVLRSTLIRFDNLWKMPFPYVMALHQAPTNQGPHDFFHFHIELHPPLRKPNLLKFLAGPEIGGGNFISDTAPEVTAAELRAVPLEHYKSRGS